MNLPLYLLRSMFTYANIEEDFTSSKTAKIKSLTLLLQYVRLNARKHEPPLVRALRESTACSNDSRPNVHSSGLQQP